MTNHNTIDYLLIGALIKFPELAADLKLKPEMMRESYAKKVLSYIEKSNGLDLGNLYLQSKKYGAEFITPDLIAEMRADQYITKSQFTSYQIEVLEAYKADELVNASAAYAQLPNKSNRQHLNETIAYLDTLYITRKDGKEKALKEILSEVNLEVKPKLMKTGYAQLDSLIGGFEGGQLIVVGARPSTGKTAFAINLGLSLEKNGCHVALFSLETTVKTITRRVLATMAKVKGTKFKSPDAFKDDEKERIAEAAKVFNSKNFIISDEDMVTPAAIRQMANKLGKESDNNVIIIDYLTLMNADGKHRDRRLEVEAISRQLKIIAKEFNCVIIALSQLSRGVEGRQDKRPMMSDLREAGGIEQDADMIFLLYRDDYYNRAETSNDFNKSEIECIIAKNKDGATGTSLFAFYKDTGGFF